MQLEDLQNDKNHFGESSFKKEKTPWISVAELLRIIIICKLFMSGEFLEHGVGEREWLKKETQDR